MVDTRETKFCSMWFDLINVHTSIYFGIVCYVVEIQLYKLRFMAKSSENVGQYAHENA